MKFQFLHLAFLLFILYSCEKTNTENKPNILIINVDDLGWKDVGFMGSEYYETPNIDDLSRQGIIFTNGYAAAANCAPSRACLMTGKWTTRHGIYTVGNSQRGNPKHRKLIPVVNTTTLSNEYEIIPEMLSKHEYITCHAGKWHLSKDPLEYGFALNIGGGHNGHPQSYYPPYKNINIKEVYEDQYLTDLIMQKSLEFIDTVSKPFFLYYAPYAVHTPIQPKNNLLNKYLEKPVSNGQNNAKYATMIENLDWNIGLLIARLKEKELFDNTLIIFTSDNGGLYGITKQAPLRAGKGSYYEGGIREPFFFVWKNRIRENTRSDMPITNLDIFPTIMNVIGMADDESKYDGLNLIPILEGKKDTLLRPLFWHFPVYLQAYKKNENENRDPLFRTRPGSAVRYGEWKLHYYFEENEMELYNLTKDIGERNNLAIKRPEKLKEMFYYLKKWWDTTNAPLPTLVNPEFEQ